MNHCAFIVLLHTMIILHVNNFAINYKLITVTLNIFTFMLEINTIVK